jgi:ABC-type Mn2+/Zn2+ transport system ATPase subunit
MDEPFTGVDAATTEKTLQLLDDLMEQSVTVLVSTHDLDMAAQRFDQVLLLNKNLVAYGPAHDVLTAERSENIWAECISWRRSGVMIAPQNRFRKYK